MPKQLLDIMRDAETMPDPWRKHWGVFYVNNRHPEIERVDFPEGDECAEDETPAESVFEDDQDALAYVMYRACRIGCPEARAAIRRIVGEWDVLEGNG